MGDGDSSPASSSYVGGRAGSGSEKGLRFGNWNGAVRGMAGLGSGRGLGLNPDSMPNPGPSSGTGTSISTAGLTHCSSLMLCCGVVDWLIHGEPCENREAVFGLSESISDTKVSRREVRLCTS